MNFIAAFLLIVSGFKEEDTFKLFVSLMCNKIPGDCLIIEGLEGLYQDNFPLLRVLQSLFMKLLEKIIPKLKKHMQDIELPEELWLSKWLSTLFVYSLPVAHCIRIWDYMFAYGVIGLLRVGIAILQYKKKELMKADFNECFELFKSLKEGHNLPGSEKLLTIADNVPIDCMELEKLRKEIAKSVKDTTKPNKQKTKECNKIVKVPAESMLNFSNKKLSVRNNEDSEVFLIDEMNTLNDEINPMINFTVYKSGRKLITANDIHLKKHIKAPIKLSKNTQN
jgi:hypothetical protein